MSAKGPGCSDDARECGTRLRRADAIEGLGHPPRYSLPPSFSPCSLALCFLLRGIHNRMCSCINTRRILCREWLRRAVGGRAPGGGFMAVPLKPGQCTEQRPATHFAGQSVRWVDGSVTNREKAIKFGWRPHQTAASTAAAGAPCSIASSTADPSQNLSGTTGLAQGGSSDTPANKQKGAAKL